MDLLEVASSRNVHCSGEVGAPNRTIRMGYSDFLAPSRPWSSLPGLKRTALPGGMLTSSPVRGLRPIPVLRGLTLKTPKRRSSMRWQRPRACLRDSKTVSTACSALVRLILAWATTAFTMSSLITRASEDSVGQMLEGAAWVVKDVRGNL